MEAYHRIEPPDSAIVRLLLAGDVMTGRGIDQALPFPGNPELREDGVRSATAYLRLAEAVNGHIARPIAFSDLWGDAQKTWRRMAPAVRLMNLETAITTGNEFAPKGINYRMDPRNTPALLAAAPQAFALANNHILDFGPDGLTETLEVLHAYGVATAGAGRDLFEAQAPATLQTDLARVLFYSAALEDSGVPRAWAASQSTSGVDLISPTEASARAFSRRIAQVRRPGDVVVVSIHWGSNWGYEVPTAHIRFAHALIDGGHVSVVHGHSSHHPRPIDVYQDRLILYGCGDLMNDYEGIRGYEAYRSQLVATYFADVSIPTGALHALRLAPFEIRRFRLATARQADVVWLARALSSESRPFDVRLTETTSGLIEADWSRAGATV